MDFTDSIPQQDRACLQAVIENGKMVNRTTLQSAVDVADTSSRAVATHIIMCRESWLHAMGFPGVVENSIEDLSFNETHLFNQKTDESLHTLKDSRPTLHSLGIDTKRKLHEQS